MFFLKKNNVSDTRACCTVIEIFYTFARVLEIEIGSRTMRVGSWR